VTGGAFLIKDYTNPCEKRGYQSNEEESNIVYDAYCFFNKKKKKWKKC